MTLSKPLHRFNRCLLFTAAGSVTSVRPTSSNLYSSVQPVFIYRADYCAVHRVYFRVYSRWFIGVFCIGVAHPWLLHTSPRILGSGAHLGSKAEPSFARIFYWFPFTPLWSSFRSLTNEYRPTDVAFHCSDSVCSVMRITLLHKHE